MLSFPIVRLFCLCISCFIALLIKKKTKGAEPANKLGGGAGRAGFGL